jgi:hypothetical protein
MEADLAQLITNSSTNADKMKNEAEFLEQAQLAQDALEQFNVVVADPKFADLIKCGAMENLMKNIVGIFHFHSSILLSKVHV